MLKNLSWILLPISLQVTAQKKYRVVDSHNDILTACIEKNVSLDADLSGKTMSDLNRFAKANVVAQLFSVWCDGDEKHPLALANREMDTLDAVIARNPDKIALTRNHREIQQAIKKHKLAAMFGVEGGHMIEDNLDNLQKFYDRGVRYMTLTWNNSTHWATSAFDETLKKDSLAKTHKGLTDFGKQVIRKMNELGMMVDLSHVGEQTFWDAIHTSTKPIIVSHSNAYALCPVFRNLKDDQIRAVAANGGVIDLNFYSGFVDSTYSIKEKAFVEHHKTELDSLIKAGVQQNYALFVVADKYPSEVQATRPPLNMLMDHLDYIVKLAGVDHVGLGSDFDGINSAPQQLDDVTSYPLIAKAMQERGYRKKDIAKIMGGNILRVLQANEK